MKAGQQGVPATTAKLNLEGTVRLVFLFLLTSGVAFTQATPTPVPVPMSLATVDISIPRGIVIPVLVTKDVRVGGNAGLNETSNTPIEFAVAQDVIWNGYLIVKVGDPVESHFTNERNATGRVFSSTTSQEVELATDDVVNFCGDTIHLHFTRTFVGGSYSNHVVGFLTLGLTGHHTNDAVFNRGAILEVHTDRFEKSICAAKTSAEMGPLPPNMVLPDDELTPSPGP